MAGVSGSVTRVKIPNVALARIEREKIVDYLLNPTHRHGAGKARFFTAYPLPS